MSDAPATAEPTNQPGPSPDRQGGCAGSAPSSTARLLGLVRWITAYGHALADWVRERPEGPACASSPNATAPPTSPSSSPASRAA